MGNRATIVTKEKDLGVYLHWYGGTTDVVPVLLYCGMHQYRSPEVDSYGWARLCQVFGNYMGGTLSLGIFPYESLPIPIDNGEYVIEGWKVIEQAGQDPEPLPKDFDLIAKLHDIDDHMPRSERLGAYIDSEVVPIDAVSLGDVTWLWNGEYPQRYTVLGFGPESVKENLRGRPYINGYKAPDEEYWQNESNYLKENLARIEKPQDWGEALFKSLFGRPLSKMR